MKIYRGHNELINQILLGNMILCLIYVSAVPLCMFLYQDLLGLLNLGLYYFCVNSAMKYIERPAIAIHCASILVIAIDYYLNTTAATIFTLTAEATAMILVLAMKRACANVVFKRRSTPDNILKGIIRYISLTNTITVKNIITITAANMVASLEHSQYFTDAEYNMLMNEIRSIPKLTLVFGHDFACVIGANISCIAKSGKIILLEARLEDAIVDDICAICRDNLSMLTMTTKCDHHYCLLCLSRWIEVSSRCPLCSAPVSSKIFRD